MHYSVLEDVVRDLFIRAVWSHKTQEKQAEIYQKRYVWMKTVEITCASLTSVGIISTIFSDCLLLRIISAVLSLGAVFIAAFFKAFDLQTMAKTNKEAACELLIVRNKAMELLTSIKLMSKNETEIERLYSKLMGEANEVYRRAPQTTLEALQMANDALNTQGDNTFSAQDIDANLPEGLKKGKKNE